MTSKRTDQYDHKWGFNDTKFEVLPNRSVIFTGDRYELCGYEIPGLIPFVEDIFEVTLDLDSPKLEVSDKTIAPAKQNKSFEDAVAKVLDTSQIATDDRTRLIHSHGQTTADEVYEVLYNEIERACDIVLFPTEETHVAEIIAAATKHNVCVVPYGGGTSVSAALKLPAGETRTIAVVSTEKLDKVLWVDSDNNKACIQAGITGRHLEEALAEHGFTSGHEPDSMEFSTLGGWIATNASGMKKNRYGNIEQIVESVTMVTPTGEIAQHDSQARVSVGVQPKGLSFGSEGNLGFITKAVINLHRLPEVTKFESLVFKDWETGVEFMRELSSRGTLPASIRLVDNIQFRSGQALKAAPSSMGALASKAQKFFLTKIKGFDLMKLVAVTIVMEGTEQEVMFQNREVVNLAKKFGGIVGGPENGKRGYRLTYAIAYIRDFLSAYNIIGETYETTVPWDKITKVCEAVDKRATELHNEHGLPGKPYVSPRVTQTYTTGVCIYFTHGFSGQGIENPGKVFGEIEKELRKTIMENGGSLSHHHGIGKLRKEFMGDIITDESVRVLKGIKETVDPGNVFGIANNVMD